MNDMYVRLFRQTLKPKHHFATHYPSLIVKYGPLRFISSIRYEANHRSIKNYTKNTNSRKSLSYSIARKLQYHFAILLKTSRGLKDKLIISKLKPTNIRQEDFFQYIPSSIELDIPLDRNIFVSHKVAVNGIVFSSQLYLPYVEQNGLQLLKIMKIIFLSKDDISSIKIWPKIWENIVQSSYR